ncbi:MAG: hypothetical protein WCK18_10475 [Prolixibacteraceae bacterium]
MNPDKRIKILEKLEDESLTEEELNILHSILFSDETLKEEMTLSKEIEEAMGEKDIILLRNQLKNITGQIAKTSENQHLTDAEAYFGLSEEVFNPVNLDAQGMDELQLGNYLQKLHIKNHDISSREVIHDLYNEKEELAEIDSQLMSPEDEQLFCDVRDALAEKEIMDLRANLNSIAKSVSIHERSFEEIEDFVDRDLDDELEALIKVEMLTNPALVNEIELHSEVNSAIGESDIMKLRSKLKNIMDSEYSHSKSIEEIDSYIYEDMDEYASALFEEELLENSGLAHDLTFQKDIDRAIAETDVMALRAKLQEIASEEQEKNTELLGVASPKRKNLYWYAAASVVVAMVAVSSLLNITPKSDQQLYASFYEPYQPGSNVSRSGTASTGQMDKAVREIDKGHYSLALNMLEKASKVGNDGFSISFYSGVALQELGQYKNAIQSFSEVIRHGDNLLVEQSEWYIGLCYLRIEERDKALKQFRSIVARNGFYKDKSSKLLKQLE